MPQDINMRWRRNIGPTCLFDSQIVSRIYSGIKLVTTIPVRSRWQKRYATLSQRTRLGNGSPWITAALIWSRYKKLQKSCLCLKCLSLWMAMSSLEVPFCVVAWLWRPGPMGLPGCEALVSFPSERLAWLTPSNTIVPCCRWTWEKTTRYMLRKRLYYTPPSYNLILEKDKKYDMDWCFNRNLEYQRL